MLSEIVQVDAAFLAHLGHAHLFARYRGLRHHLLSFALLATGMPAEILCDPRYTIGDEVGIVELCLLLCPLQSQEF